MELFDNLVIPVGSAHIELIRYLLLTAMLLLVAYSGLLFGSMYLSINSNRIFKKTKDIRYFKLSQDYINISTGIPSMWFGLALIPFLSIILTYAQLLHGSGADVIGYLIIGFFLYLGALTAIYSYRNALNFKKVISLLESNIKSTSKDKVKSLDDLKENYTGVGNLSSISGIVLLFLAIWFLIGSTTYTYDSTLWGESIFSMLFSANTLLKLLLVLLIGFAFTTGTALFLNFYWDGGKEFEDDETAAIYKNHHRKYGLILSFAIPVVYALNVATTPKESISGLFFLYALLSLLSIVFYAQSVYLTNNDNHKKAPKYAFLTVLFAIVFFVLSDQKVFRTSSEENVMKIAAVHDKIEADRLVASSGTVDEPAFDGEDIFKKRCSACHRFDTKLVGPAYNDVLPKYKDKMDELVKFVLNPYPVNPAEYPGGMANQGLKPGEAKAVANYIIGVVYGDTDEEESEANSEEEIAEEKQ